MLLPFLILLASAAVMYKSSEEVIKHSIILAQMLGLSTFVFGFIIVSISTSLPELAVALFSSLEKTPALSVGNLLGANFADLTFILGLCTVFGGTIYLKKKEGLELVKLLFVSSMVSVFVFYSEGLSVIHGLILLFLFTELVRRMYKGGRVSKRIFEEHEEPGWQVATKFVVAISFLLISAKFIVEAALDIAAIYNVSTTFIGATIVALGTTLPELSVELTAIRQGKYALAMGDLFGSSVTNITLVLGALSIANPGRIDTKPLLNLFLFLIAAIFIIWYALTDDKKITKEHGFVLLVLYVLFLMESWVAGFIV